MIETVLPGRPLSEPTPGSLVASPVRFTYAAPWSLGFAPRRSSEPEVLNLSQMLRHCRDARYPALDFQFCESTWAVRGDADQIRKALDQLLCFLATETSPDRPIRVDSANVALLGEGGPGQPSFSLNGACLLAPHRLDARPGQFVRLRMRIPRCPEPAPTRLFQTFGSPWRRRRGSGFALDLAQGLVNEQGGWIEHRPRPDGGFDLALFLPRWLPPLPRGEPLGDCFRNRSILFVEDQAVLRGIGTDLLESLGLRVLGADSAREALNHLHDDSQTIRVVLLDLTLPEEDLRELHARLRSHAAPPPLLLCGALPTPAIQHAVARFRAAGFVAKPFRLRELFDAIRAAMDAPR